jgi:cell division protein FtsZ
MAKKKKVVKRKKRVAKKNRAKFLTKKKHIAKTIKKENKNKKESVKTKQVLAKNSDLECSSESFFKAKIRVIGIGGGGSSIVSEIGRSLSKASFFVADTDIRSLRKRPGIKYFWFGENLTRGLGTGANTDLAKKAAEQVKDKLKEIFNGQDIIIFIASLGGGLGSGATEIFAKVAKEFDGITFGIFTLPFKFEGKNKTRIAQNALKSIRPLLNVSLAIPNERIFRVIDANTPITQAFSMVNKSLTTSLESLISLIYNPGIINIDFADLKTILKGNGNLAFLNTVQEFGEDRADKICKKVLFNPLLQNNRFVPEKILFNIAGSDNLSMFEVEKISRHISEANPKAKIIFGISKNPKLKGKIKTTILMTGEGSKLDLSEEKQQNFEISVKNAEKEKPQKIHKKINKANKSKKLQKAEKNKNLSENLFVPAFYPEKSQTVSFAEKRISIIDAESDIGKKAIRRSGLEIKKAQEQEEKKKLAQEKEWEIPAFLRRVKFNK